jgi:hypothetical protein
MDLTIAGFNAALRRIPGTAARMRKRVLVLCMFGLFKHNDKEVPSPVKEEIRHWIDGSFNWLMNNFGEAAIKHCTVLTPHYSHFPIKYDGDPQTATDTINILTRQMDIDPDDILLNVYTEGLSELSSGSPFGDGIYLSQLDDEKYSGGLYFGKEEDGKYHIGLENKKLLRPESLIATLAHELAHIKLLGEHRITENDERLTDLATIFFGLGIFNANAAFMTYQGLGYRTWSKLGYLTPMEWGYGLALFAHIRGEKHPGWASHLSVHVKSDFENSARFIERNEGLILK